MLSKEYKYFIDNKERLLRKYYGEFVVIKDCKIIGVYKSLECAIIATTANHKIGTFLIQECTPYGDIYFA